MKGRSAAMETTEISRMDDLGRIHIPKSIRRNCGFKEGDLFEVKSDGNCIILKKNMFLDSMKAVCKMLYAAMASNGLVHVAIYGNSRKLSGHDSLPDRLTSEFLQSVDNKSEAIQKKTFSEIKWTVPIIANLECIGYICGSDFQEGQKHEAEIKLTLRFLRYQIESVG